MKSRNQILALAAFAFVSTSAQAATVALTSVDQLVFTNVVKAYDFTGSNSLASKGTSFDIGGVTFTRHFWENSVAHGGLTMTGLHTAQNQTSGAPNITLGGTVADRANLNELLDVWNIGAGQDNTSVLMTIVVPDGSYNIQFLVGTSSNRENELFDTDSGSDVSLGSYSGGGNFLVTGTAVATGGTLNLKLFGTPGTGDGRPVMSGLIVSAIPEPSTTAFLGLGGLALILRRRK